MKIDYDKKADALSISVQEGRISRDIELARNIFAGFDCNEKLIEIQFLEISKMRKSPQLLSPPPQRQRRRGHAKNRDE